MTFASVDFTLSAAPRGSTPASLVALATVFAGLPFVALERVLCPRDSSPVGFIQLWAGSPDAGGALVASVPVAAVQAQPWPPEPLTLRDLATVTHLGWSLSRYGWTPTLATLPNATLATLIAYDAGPAQTFDAASESVTLAATPTDFAELVPGAGGAWVEGLVLTAITSGSSGSAGAYVEVLRRTTPDTGGTAVVVPSAPRLGGGAATAVARVYTANPTLGTAGARVDRWMFGSAIGPAVAPRGRWTWEPQPVYVPPGTSLVVSMGSAPIVTIAAVTWTWREVAP